MLSATLADIKPPQIVNFVGDEGEGLEWLLAQEDPDFATADKEVKLWKMMGPDFYRYIQTVTGWRSISIPPFVSGGMLANDMGWVVQMARKPCFVLRPSIAGMRPGGRRSGTLSVCGVAASDTFSAPIASIRPNPPVGQSWPPDTQGLDALLDTSVGFRYYFNLHQDCLISLLLQLASRLLCAANGRTSFTSSRLGHLNVQEALKNFKKNGVPQDKAISNGNDDKSGGPA
ncbi:hypothetical protein BZA05DRAFT_442239 [Tricharina praecox]|uniref:uncharacterized protein n=1 Tax=Tricharina praecox TaxID=43433 RepID=UPI00221FC019|nr:uncharacterized protein BZA05DRAFT_442239 [Tricharina praecox]KAI5856566.1 hypothetical protein BZA05DRAFT_442239 [Tricharina praecox]